MHVKRITASAYYQNVDEAAPSTYRITTAAHENTLQPPSAPLYNLLFCNICAAAHFNVDSMHAVTRWYAVFLATGWPLVWKVVKCPALSGWPMSRWPRVRFLFTWWIRGWYYVVLRHWYWYTCYSAQLS